jgi:fructan beta-fructosidase
MVLAYTSTGRGECIAYSTDRGHSWTEYDKNPVVKHAGRDPKLVWYAPGKHWVMAVYDEAGGKRGIAFYSSPDLKAWTFQSKIDDFYECPDLFELPVYGGKGWKWVLYAADGKYIVGTFDGKRFTKESDKQQLWYGNFYAAQTFDNVPLARRIQIGWAQGVTFPGMPFNQQMTLPVTLQLAKTTDGLRLMAKPVSLGEIEYLAHALNEPVTLGPELRTVKREVEIFRLTLTIRPPTSGTVRLQIRGLDVTYDVGNKTLACGKVVAPVKPVNGTIALDCYVDRGSIEIFTQGGMVAVSIAHIAKADAPMLTAAGDGGTLAVEWRPMKSAWK